VEPATAQPPPPPAASSADPVRVVRRIVVTEGLAARSDAGKATHRMRLEAAVLNGTGWTIESVLQAVRAAAAILGQCGIVLERLVLNEVDAPASYRFLDTPYSRRLAHQLGLAKPTLYFVADTAHRPAFDAEAIGRGNSRTRPEMAD